MSATTEDVVSEDVVAQNLTDLPADMLRAVCVRIVMSRDVVRLCRTCRAFSQCCDDSFLAARAQQIGDVPERASLEIMALHEELKLSLLQLEDPDRLMDLLEFGCYSAQVGFQFGGKTVDCDDGGESGVCNSRGRINVIAEALLMHPSATAVIEGHVGITAPSSVAIEYSVARGTMVAAILVWQHNIDVSRLRVRGWGKRLCRKASRSTHPNGDVFRSGYGPGEMFVELLGIEMPRRPDYYPPRGDDLGNTCEISGQSLAAKVAKVSRVHLAARGPPAPIAPLAGGRRAGLDSDALRAMIRSVAPASLPAPGTIEDHCSSDEDENACSDEESASNDATDSEHDDDSSQGEDLVEIVVEEGSEEIARLI